MDRALDVDGENYFEQEKTDDHLFLRNKIKQIKEHKIQTLANDYIRKKNLGNNNENGISQYIERQSLHFKGKILTDHRYFKILEESFNKIHPLILLTPEQRKAIKDKIIFEKFDQKVLLYSGMESDYDPGEWACFILLEGEIHIFNNKKTFQDLINNITFFGYDGPIFQKRFSTVLLEKNTVLGIIQQKDFLEIVKPFSKFATFISRNIRYKDKVLDDLSNFKNFILNSIDRGPIDIAKLIQLYGRISSCMHPKAFSEELDVSAWIYALNRLPSSVIETFIFILVNKPPRLLSLSDEIANQRMPRLHTNARNRDIFRYLDGKNVIIVREMETDVLDFISNICIHIIESTKLRRYITSPITIKKIDMVKNSFDNTVNVLMNTTGLHLSENEIKILKQHFGNTFADNLISLCLNYQDISITISKESMYDKDPVENWIQNLWEISKELLNVNSSVDEVEDLIVDIIQGSKKTLLSCISPHMYMIKDEILAWAEHNKIQLKTKRFLNEVDRLIAYSFYYYNSFPQKAREKAQLDLEHGIVTIENTFSTGVKVLLINVNRLNPLYIDPYIRFKTRSKNHLIIHIGYTFGAQSHQIIKPLLMLFGSKSHSMNIIGKAGGLQGERTDILIASKIFHDKTHDLSSIHYGDIDVEDLKKTTKSNIHLGPMLTVAGTILQNYDLLNYYKYIMGCIGLEMEGYYFAREIENSIKHGLIKEDFITRCFYYASDLPLDPNQNLCQEEGNVSWDEGIGSMNAIQRYILNQILT